MSGKLERRMRALYAHEDWREKFFSVVAEAKADIAKIFPEHELGGTLAEYLKAKKELVKVQLEVYGKASRDEVRMVKIVEFFLHWFGVREVEQGEKP